jgi:hypothetical protein
MMHAPRSNRREFLGAALVAGAGWGLAGRSFAQSALRGPVPKVNGGVNVQPLRRFGVDAPGAQPLIDPGLVEVQLEQAYALGFDGLRITVPFADTSNLLASLAYVRAARAVGIDAVCILTDFSGLATAQALLDARRRPELLTALVELFARPVAPAGPAVPEIGRIAFQILNEPTHFTGLAPESYVREVLRPTFTDLKRLAPEVIVVSAAEVGNTAGPLRVRAMLEAGLQDFCDRIAYHVYSEKAIGALGGNVDRLVWITESGASEGARHLPWVRDVFPRIRAGIDDVSRIFYYVLYGTEPGFRVIDIVPGDAGGWRARDESAELLAFWRARVRAAEGGRVSATWRELVPDVTAYFATRADLRVVERLERL